MRVGADILNSLNIQNDPINALVIYNGGYAKPKISYTYAKKVLTKAQNYKALMPLISY